ncbi:hypothetical protein D3C87_1407000 [compost metagenome]
MKNNSTPLYAILVFRTDDVFFGYWLGKNEKSPFDSISINNARDFGTHEICAQEIITAREFAKENGWNLSFKVYGQ